MIIEYTSDISSLITNKADLVDGKVPAEQLPSYVDDVIEFNNLQVPDTQISIIVGNNSYKNQIRFINGSSTSSNRIGSEDKYPNMFVNFGENTSEDDWTTFEPEESKIYVNTTNNHSYRWSSSYLIDLDSNWSNDIKDLKANVVRSDVQTLSADKQKQVFENLGWKVYVSTSDVIMSNSAIPDDVMEEIVNCQAILLSDTGKMLFKGNQDTNIIYFLTFGHNNNVQELIVRPTNKTSQNLQSSFINDQYAVKYNTTQNLTNAQQDISLHNIGLDFVHVDYALLNTTLDDSMVEAINKAKGIILVNVPENFTRSFVYIKGLSNSTIIRFLTIGNNTILDFIDFKKSNNTLSQLQQADLHFDSVRYTITQALTDAQKQQARTNIGAASSDDVFNDYVANGGTKTTKAAMYTELAAQLNNNTVVLDNSVANTTVSGELGDKIANATNIIFKNGTYATYNLFKTSNTINAVNPIFVGFSEVRDECTLAILTYTASSRYLSYTVLNTSPKGYFNKIKDTNPTVDFDKVYKYLFNNVAVIDQSLLGTTITNTTIQNSISNATQLIIKPTNTAKSPLIFNVGTITLDEGVNNKFFFAIRTTLSGSIEITVIEYNTTTYALGQIYSRRAISCYDEYKLAGGTKYTTETDFNAQFVKVMDMTIAE